MELTSYARGGRSFSRLTLRKFVPDVLKSFLLIIFILKETSNSDKLRFAEQEAAGSNHSRINTRRKCCLCNYIFKRLDILNSDKDGKP